MTVIYGNCFVHLVHVNYFEDQEPRENFSFLWAKDSGTIISLPSLCSQSLLCSGPNSSGEISHSAGLVLDLLGMVCSPTCQRLLCVGASPKSLIQGHRQKQTWNVQLQSSQAVSSDKAVLPLVFIKSLAAEGNNRLVRFDKKT